MPQVMVTVAPAAFYYALNHNRRRRPRIAEACSSPEEIILALSQAFHHTSPELPGVRTGNGVSMAHRERLSKFYSGQAIIRCAIEGRDDSRGGYVVLNGELLGLHHIDHKHGDWMMADAVAHGAVRLNCFDEPHLTALYGRFDFREVRREPNHTPGKPDVIYMERVV